MSEVADRVKSIVVDKLGVQPDQVTETASFITDLGADSLESRKNQNCRRRNSIRRS